MDFEIWLKKVKVPEEEEADLELENFEIWISQFLLKKVKVPDQKKKQIWNSKILKFGFKNFG